MQSTNRFGRRSTKKQMSEINVVPYIDVMLVLLIIFMVTTPLLTTGVDVELPQAQANSIDTQNQEPFVVTVDIDGNYYLNDNEEPVDTNQVRAAAAAVLRRSPETQFMVRGDKDALFDQAVTAMVMLQQAGVPSVGIVTKSPQDQ